MSIYITQQKKEELEAKIVELENQRIEHEKVEIGLFDSILAAKTSQAIDLLREILAEAVVLPVEESWEKYVHPALVPFFEKDLPNGVIIQKK